jgi:hypothetical protein
LPNQRNDNYSIIPHTSQPQILLLYESAGWTLPHYSTTMPAKINVAIQAHLGFTTTVLSCTYGRYKDNEWQEQHRVYLLENHSPDVSPPDNGRWVNRAELANLFLAVPEHRSVLEEWFADVEGEELHEQWPPWMRTGWFASAAAWIQEQLAALGYTQSAPIEQVVVSTWSTVLRVPATTGSLYFKASSSVFAFEPTLTHALHCLVPMYVPKVLVIDGQRHWMLMQDGGKELRSVRHHPVRSEKALRLYAQMQIDLAAHVETLKAIGCPDQRLHLLPRLYKEILASKPFLLIDTPDELALSEYEQLLAFVPQLQEICEELASYHVPESLHHDDLHSRNILYNDETYIFFDWAECYLTHPFCSMFVMLRDAKYVLKYDDQTVEHLRQAYLMAWTHYEPMERLQRAFVLAERLGSLHRALTWFQFALQVEPDMRWMYQDRALYYLRMLLGTGT